MSQTQHRTVAQDAAKGLMVIAVIFFHCYLMTFTNHADALSKFNILGALFPFLLSSFFFYAGYNYTQNERTFKENVIRRSKQLLIPLAVAFVVSTVLISSMELAFNHNDIQGAFQNIGNSILYSLMSEPLSWMVGFPKSGGIVFEIVLALGLLWFLYALFICSIFFYLLVKHTNKKLSTLISVVVGLLILAFVLGQFVGVYLPYTVQSYPVILAIMLTAAHLRKHHFLNKRVRTKKGIILKGINVLIAEGIIVGTCLTCYFQFGATTTGSLPGGKFDYVLKGFDAFISYAFGILGTYFLHTICRLLRYVPFLGKSLQWVGNHSAMFYLFHPIFLDLTAITIFQKKIVWGMGQAFFYVLVVVILLTGTCLLIDFIIKKTRNKQIAEEIRKNEAPEDLELENEQPNEQ